MKKVLSVLFAAFLIFAVSLPVLADDYKDDVYRFNDFTGTFSDNDAKRLNAAVDEMIPELKTDLPVYVFDSLGEESFDEKANYFYEHNGFGYGDDKSGILLAIYLGDKPTFDLYRFGTAKTLIDDKEEQAIGDAFVSDFASVSYYTVIDRYLGNVSFAVKGNFTAADADSTKDAEKDTAASGEENAGDLPTVVDNADVLTEDEEEELSSRIEEIRDKYDVNYVILTGDDNEGLSADGYAFEFLKENGYDSDGQSAVVFYICFEPGNRCWRTATRNSVYKKFTEDVINDIDDHIEPDMKAGDYFDACLTHAKYVKNIVSGKYRKPVDWTPVIISLLVGSFVGLIVGLMRLSSCKKAMRVVAPVDAHEYLVKDSFNLRDKQVYYLYTTVTKTAKPKSSSSSGGSSYSSSSSGGGSSSGGRSF